MNSINIEAPAKINLALDVLGKRPDGYHDICMIMQSIELHDVVHIETVNEGIEITCSSPYIPTGSENTAYKAARLLMDNYGITKGVKIHIDKKIPIAAGLGGGSSDAAAVLKGMNNLFSIGLSDDELALLGKKVGADVPYCVKGGTMLAQGIGEILTPIGPLPRVDIVLVKPRISVSTRWVYNNLQMEKILHRPNIGLLTKAIMDGDIPRLANNMANVLETVTAGKYSDINEIKKRLMKAGALGSIMSGSGPSVFGIFSDRLSAETACKSISDKRWDVFLTNTI